MTAVSIRPLLQKDWGAVSKIYAEGISTGMATFETEVPGWKQWHASHTESCRLVAVKDAMVIGFGALAKVSQREVYNGVAEVSVYVDRDFWRQQIGERLLNALITASEDQGFWTLQAAIFSLNEASIELHKKCGFRVVGLREKIGKLNGKWYDNHLLERRSLLID
jgi:phosphinothricin acetyltransferase